LENLLDGGLIKGLAHITGGGLLENIPRILPEGIAVEVVKGSWPVLPVFELLSRTGNVSEREMYRTFNMGVGMVIVTGSEDVSRIREHLEARKEACYEIGRTISGPGTVSLIDG
jgi:phosphoribosylformylglycinamidine cyclo-ligase